VTWVLLVLASVVVVFLALMLLPFGIRFDGEVDGGVQSRMCIRPCAPLLPWITLPGTTPHAGKTAADGTRAGAKSPRPSMRAIGTFVREAWSDLGGILEKTDVRSFQVDGRIGLRCPAETGHLMGLTEAIKPLIPDRLKRHTILVFDFEREALAGQLNLEARLRPVVLIAPSVRLLRLWKRLGDQQN